MIAHELSPVGRFDKILLATDGSDFSAGATRVAVAMAAKAGAKLFVVTALRDPSDGIAPELDQEKRSAAQAILAAVRQAAEAAKVLKLREHVYLIHKLRELVGSKKFFQNRHERARV